MRILPARIMKELRAVRMSGVRYGTMIAPSGMRSDVGAVAVLADSHQSSLHNAEMNHFRTDLYT